MTPITAAAVSQASPLRAHITRALMRAEGEAPADIDRRDQLRVDLAEAEALLLVKQRFIEECKTWLKDYPE